MDIQSDLLSALPTRLVLPLALRATMPSTMPKALCPPMSWDGEELVALAHLAAPFRVKDLGQAKGNLRMEASALIGAVDAVISGI